MVFDPEQKLEESSGTARPAAEPSREQAGIGAALPILDRSQEYLSSTPLELDALQSDASTLYLSTDAPKAQRTNFSRVLELLNEHQHVLPPHLSFDIPFVQGTQLSLSCDAVFRQEAQQRLSCNNSFTQQVHIMETEAALIEQWNKRNKNPFRDMNERGGFSVVRYVNGNWEVQTYIGPSVFDRWTSAARLLFHEIVHISQIISRSRLSDFAEEVEAHHLTGEFLKELNISMREQLKAPMSGKDRQALKRAIRGLSDEIREVRRKKELWRRHLSPIDKRDLQERGITI